MKTRTILITAGAVIAGLALVGWQKIKTLKAVFDRMSIRPSGISAFVPGLVKITFRMSFKITNPTNEAFSVTGASIATLKRIKAYYNGRFMGMADVNLTEIDIPSNSYVELKNIPFTVATENLLDTILTVDEINLNNLTIHAIVEVFGNEYLIEG